MSAAHPERLRVLVVDDSPDQVVSTAALLRAWGHEPVPCHDGHAALAAA